MRIGFWISVLAFFLGLTFQASSQYVTQTSPLPEGREKYGAVVVGNYVYVIGGYTEKEHYTRSVIRAEIMPGGQLGPWFDCPSLPDKRAYIANSTFSDQNRIYVIGGFDGEKPRNTVIWTYISNDGNLARWRESRPFPKPGLRSLTALSTGGYLLVIGGCTLNQKPTDKVYMGSLVPNGDVNTWVQGPSLPRPLWAHHAAALNGRVWVWGGLADSSYTSATKEVFSAPIQGEGIIGNWRNESVSLPSAFYHGASIGMGYYLLTFCVCYTGGKGSSDIYYSQVDRGGLSEWSRFDSGLPMDLHVAVAPDYTRNNVYIPGGKVHKSNREVLENRVFLFRVSREKKQIPRSQSSAVIDSSQLKGFVNYEEARNILAEGNKPLACYFHDSTSPDCSSQVSRMHASPNFREITEKAVFVLVDTIKSPTLAQQFGIFRTPAWIFYHTDETIAKTHYGVLSVKQIQDIVESLK